MKCRYLIYVNFSIRTDILSYFMLPILLSDFYTSRGLLVRDTPTSNILTLFTQCAQTSLAYYRILYVVMVHLLLAITIASLFSTTQILLILNRFLTLFQVGKVENLLLKFDSVE